MPVSPPPVCPPRTVRDLLAKRGKDVSRHLGAWVRKFGVLLAEAGRRYAEPLGRRWFVNETYLRVGTKWAYLYRAVDEQIKSWTSRTGKTRAAGPSSLLREKRDVESAKAFFEQAIQRRGIVPEEVITEYEV